MPERCRGVLVRLVAASAIGVWGCIGDGGEPARPSTTAEPDDALAAVQAYLADPAARRQALRASVSVADTEYGRLRLAHYSLAGDGIDDPWNDWDLTPEEARGPVRRLRVAEEGQPPPEPFVAEDVVPLGTRLETIADYRALGQRAFELCPLDISIPYRRIRESAAAARRYGLHVTDAGEVRGAVELRSRGGSWLVALTCAACHSSTAADGTQLPGLSNPELRLAELNGAPADVPGTMDVTNDGIWNPVRAPDLRPLALQARLHHTGNLDNGRIARMVRIETLIAGRRGFESRPPRRIVAAMALYLESLAEELPAPDWETPGGELFRASCGACHRGDEMAGPPVSVDLVGTDAAATMDGARGTGSYRAPSLRGVGARRSLLHDGTAASLEAVLGLTETRHRGHPFGRELSEASRRAIARFLSPVGAR